MADLAEVLSQIENAVGASHEAALAKAVEKYFDKRKIKTDDISADLINFIMKNASTQASAPSGLTDYSAMALNLPDETIIDCINKPIKSKHLQKIICDLLVKNNVYLYGKAGTGKAQPLYSKLLTPDGWKTMGDIKVGDLVISDNGRPTTVKAVYDRGLKKVYRVTMQDGSYTDTCDEHLWRIYNGHDRSNNTGGRVLSLKDIKIKKPNGKNDAFIPITKPVQFTPKKHILDPYLIGVLIGDGCMRLSYATITKCDRDEELINKVKKLLPKGITLHKYEGVGKSPAYGITKTKRSNGLNVVTEELSRLGLMYKKSIDKFIPDEYMYDSIENRIKLLQGLNDTDAYASKTMIEYSTSSEKLKNDYVEIVQSLGGICIVNERMPSYRGKNGEIPALSYRITVKLPNEIPMFSLKRKKDAAIVRTKYFPARYIVDIKYLGEFVTRCILVDSPSHLYLTDDYIVTHNTFLAEHIAKMMKREGFIINCSEWTTPTEIIGGQTLSRGFIDGQLVKAWKYGGMLILDELPKLNANTAGLLNQALAAAGANIIKCSVHFDGTEFKVGTVVRIGMTDSANEVFSVSDANPQVFYHVRAGKIYSIVDIDGVETKPEKLKDGTVIYIYPTIKDAKGEKIPKHPGFCCIANGNTTMKALSADYSGNNRQDYSLVDRFAGSYYLVDFDAEVEVSETYFFVYDFMTKMREQMEQIENITEFVSLRTMINMNKIYELEMLMKLDSAIIPENIRSGIGQANVKRFSESIKSFVDSIDFDKRTDLITKLPILGEPENIDRQVNDSLPRFTYEFWKMHGSGDTGKDPVTGEKLSEKEMKERYPDIDKH